MRSPSLLAQRTPVRFNLTPLIDVVFLLIIFFLVASHFVRNEQAEPVSLPLALQGERDEEAAPHRLTVTVSRTGALFIGGQAQSEQTVTRQISELQEQAARVALPAEVRIRSDRDAPYRHLRTLLEQCAASGIRRILFAVSVSSGPVSGERPPGP